MCMNWVPQTQGTAEYPTIQRSVVRVWYLVPVETHLQAEDLGKPEEQFHGNPKGPRLRTNTLSSSLCLEG